MTPRRAATRRDRQLFRPPARPSTGPFTNSSGAARGRSEHRLLPTSVSSSTRSSAHPNTQMSPPPSIMTTLPAVALIANELLRKPWKSPPRARRPATRWPVPLARSTATAGRPARGTSGRAAATAAACVEMNSEPTRYGDASMAWDARNLISTQAQAGHGRVECNCSGHWPKCDAWSTVAARSFGFSIASRSTWSP